MRLPNRHAGAKRRARPDPDGQLQLVIQISTRPKSRHGLGCRLTLAVRPPHLTRQTHRAGPAVIADRHPFIIRQQRLIGPHQRAHGLRMMDASIEIRVVADVRGQVQKAIRRTVQQMRPRIGPVGQQRADGIPQRPPRPGTQRQERIQRWPDAAMGGGLRLIVQQLRLMQRAQIEDHGADRDPAPRGPGQRAEHAKRQVLDRKVRVALRALYPAGQRGVVRVVDHGAKFRCRPDQHAA